jgi:hypothetical protein
MLLILSKISKKKQRIIETLNFGHEIKKKDSYQKLLKSVNSHRTLGFDVLTYKFNSIEFNFEAPKSQFWQCTRFDSLIESSIPIDFFFVNKIAICAQTFRLPWRGGVSVDGERD